MKKDSRTSEAESLKQQQQLLLFLDLRTTAKKKGEIFCMPVARSWKWEGKGQGREDKNGAKKNREETSWQKEKLGI